MATQNFTSGLGMPWTTAMPMAAPHSRSMMKTSSRASARAISRPWLLRIFGVRKKGMLLVKKP
ncbi:hypothetical protein D3C76_1755310 [compost metagenome]